MEGIRTSLLASVTLVHFSLPMYSFSQFVILPKTCPLPVTFAIPRGYIGKKHSVCSWTVQSGGGR